MLIFDRSIEILLHVQAAIRAPLVTEQNSFYRLYYSHVHKKCSMYCRALYNDAFIATFAFGQDGLNGKYQFNVSATVSLVTVVMVTKTHQVSLECQLLEVTEI